MEEYDSNEEIRFEIEWQYFFLILALCLIFGAFFYVAYNTISGVRESVHRNFNGYQGSYAGLNVPRTGALPARAVSNSSRLHFPD